MMGHRRSEILETWIDLHYPRATWGECYIDIYPYNYVVIQHSTCTCVCLHEHVHQGGGEEQLWCAWEEGSWDATGAANVRFLVKLMSN